MNLQNQAQLAQAIIDLRETYKTFQLPQPPLPDNFLQMVPCSLVVTETHGENGLLMGKVLITNLEEQTLYEQEWLLSPDKS
jgi:hypothetical protein